MTMDSLQPTTAATGSPRLRHFENIIPTSEGGDRDASSLLLEDALRPGSFVLDPAASNANAAAAAASSTGHRRFRSGRTPAQIRCDAIQDQITASTEMLSALLRKDSKSQYAAHLSAHIPDGCTVECSDCYTGERYVQNTDILTAIYGSVLSTRSAFVEEFKRIVSGHGEHLEIVEVSTSRSPSHWY